MSPCLRRGPSTMGCQHLTDNFRTEDGQDIDVRTFGIIDMDSPAGKVFNLQPDMATVPFGWASKLRCLLSLLFCT